MNRSESPLDTGAQRSIVTRAMAKSFGMGNGEWRIPGGYHCDGVTGDRSTELGTMKLSVSGWRSCSRRNQCWIQGRLPVDALVVADARNDLLLEWDWLVIHRPLLICKKLMLTLDTGTGWSSSVWKANTITLLTYLPCSIDVDTRGIK
jgi:hypothetical protein